MKILIVSKYHSVNPFVSTIVDELLRMNINITADTKEFWNNYKSYDIIHFQWPEEIFNWKKNINNSDLNRFIYIINDIKKSGIKTCITCHNLKPHITQCVNISYLYELLYSSVDAIFHMGKCSESIFREKYPHTKHFYLPHHVYNTKYRFDIDKIEARKKLNINLNKRIILAFGNFRNNKERKMILSLKEQLSSNYLILTPGFYRKKIKLKNPVQSINTILHRIYFKLKGLKFEIGFINDYKTELYFSAADIVLIQRIDILNSGNLPMAFAAGKIVVGPAIGNVGDILSRTNNFVFDPLTSNSISELIIHTFDSKYANIGKQNKEYSMLYWSTEKITRELLCLYDIIFTI